jgi:hypothetical protein
VQIAEYHLKLFMIPSKFFRRVNHSISVPVCRMKDLPIENYLLNNHTGRDGDISNTVTEGSDSQA